MLHINIKDVLLTPFYLIIIYIVAYIFYTSIKDNKIRPYFFPALTAKIIGALALGIIYQFYYGGGDTFNFFNDSEPIWKAFINSPFTAIRIIFAQVGDHSPDIYRYTRHIYFFSAGDGSTYNVIRVAGLLSLFSFHTYTVIAIGFAVLSFTGMRAMYKAFYDLFPKLHWPLAVAIFFIPSVYFWGSGLMKDTITLGALGWLFHGIYFGIIRRQKMLLNIAIAIMALWVIKSIKLYILIAFLPGLSLWIFLQYRSQIRSRAIRFFSLPFLLMMAIPLGYLAIIQVTADNERYQLENIATTTQTTSNWLKTVSDRDGGSGYSLGEFDGSVGGLVGKFPRAIWLGLFQPHPWQAGRSPVMLLSALESTFFLYLTFRILMSVSLFKIYGFFFKEPILILCFSFTIILVGAVAISSYNFGTMVRYRIPFIPFYLSFLYILRYKAGKRISIF